MKGREIKFRAWDSERNKMFEQDFQVSNLGVCHTVEFPSDEANDYLVKAQKQEVANYMLVDLTNWYGSETLQLMQYTGLKDKNGKDVYEGDIVRFLHTGWVSKSDDDPRTLDEYLRDIAELKVVIWRYNGFYVSHQIDGFAEDMEPGERGYIEVIGNIFANPELLGGKDE